MQNELQHLWAILFWSAGNIANIDKTWGDTLETRAYRVEYFAVAGFLRTRLTKDCRKVEGRIWWIIKTTLYRLMPKSLYQKNSPIIGKHVAVKFVVQ